MRGTRGATRSSGQRLLYPPPSLDLRFAETKSLTDWISGQNLITFTRASSATVINAAGALETVASNVPRFDHNPLTGESLGLLVEEARTNSIRNNTMQGAVAGTPGTLPTNWVAPSSPSGLSREIVGVGTESGISYIDIRYSGTASSALLINIIPDDAISAAPGQSWTASSYISLVGGSTANITSAVQRIRAAASGGAFVSGTDATIVPTSGALNQKRSTVTLSSAGATVATVGQYIVLSANNGAAIDITLRIGLPQLEQGAFATSVIPTTTATATRSADVASITDTAFSSWYRQDEGTMFAKAVPLSTAGNGIAGFDDNTSAERWRLGHTGTTAANLIILDDNVIQATTQTATNSWPLNTSGKAAGAVKLNDSAVSVNGQAAVGDLSCTMPTVTQMTIGTARATVYANARISRLTYWPQRLPNNSLVAITR